MIQRFSPPVGFAEGESILSVVNDETLTTTKTITLRDVREGQ